ncbi:MAG: M15 family metallopeptidase [Hyphomicrobiaceae bacterium]|nr:M15 family metallopeptidase [Hyphomicrobiaceae bacterium]
MRANAAKLRAAATTLSRLLSCVASTLVASTTLAAAGPPEDGGDTAAKRLLAAYPEHLAAVEGASLVWHDGSRTAYDDGRGTKQFEEWLAAPDVEDMLEQPYPAGTAATPPPAGHDPGRARNAEFFRRIYGDCRKGGVERELVDVVWLPRKFGRPVKVTRINGVAERLAAVSRELDALPERFNRYLKPPAGTFVCRDIAGTTQPSAHGYGIAIDIALSQSDYWRWSKPGPDGAPIYRNRVPLEIVEVFERHGFIWGGRWHHYDTMHFEYRPELLPPKAPLR